MKELIGSFPEESGFVSRFRKHQGWWRAFVLNEEQGEYFDDRNKVFKKVCNRMKNGKANNNNFLSDEITTVVKQTVEDQKKSKSGIINEDRLYNNLLSSQPLAFNFFALFKLNPPIALAFLKTLRPDITEVFDVVFETAPKGASDHSAFDFGFVVKSTKGTGFMGFECKYTDTFSYKNPKSKVNYGDKTDMEEEKHYQDYFKLYSQSRDRFPADYFEYVRNPDYNQLFRNELLAVKFKSEYDFVITGLFCHQEDKETVNAGLEFQKKIGNGHDDFILLTYAQYFEILQRQNLSWQQRELVMLLWTRYCGLKLSAEVLGNSK
jgi:hypothetical protein